MLLIRIFVLIVLFLGITNSGESQTAHLNIKMTDGSTVQYTINEIKKITFDNMTNIDDTRKISTVISKFKLLQNYPNPFNPTTSIEYTIPRKGSVEIKIYNVNGILINSINHEYTQPGNYAINWDGKNNLGNSVASGLYFYQAKFENSIISKRMIFIK